MSKGGNMFEKVKFSKKDLNRIERGARRNAEDKEVFNTGSKIHKNKVKYKREKYRHEG